MNNKFLKEYKEYKAKFTKLYHSELLSILRTLEADRKKRLRKFLLVLLASIVTLLITIVCGLFYNSTNAIAEILNWTFGITAFVGLLISISLYDSFTMDIKSECMQKLMLVFKSIKWKGPSGSIPDNFLTKSELFPMFSTKSSDDYFEGIYSGVNFKVDELRLDSYGGKQVFKGVVFNFKFNKPIKNKTIIISKKEISSKIYNILYYAELIIFALMAILLSKSSATRNFYINDISKNFKKQKKYKHEKMQELKLEDPVFSKRYEAYSSDQIEGRYLITTAFMERFQNLQTAFQAKSARCSFFDDNIMIALSTNKNVFEIGNLFRPLTDFKTMETFFNEIISIYLIIDLFKLNEKTKM